MRIDANPTKVLSYKRHVDTLSQHLHVHLQTLKTTKNTTSFEQSAAKVLKSSIAAISIDAYKAAAVAVSSVPSISTIHSLDKKAVDRANLSASLMSTASKLSLEISSAISKRTVASISRAEKAGVYEGRLAYFLGTTLGWQLNKKSKKLWCLSGTHDLDDQCDDNADDGPISVYDFFTSGVMYCPAHINCSCYMALIL